MGPDEAIAKAGAWRCSARNTARRSASSAMGRSEASHKADAYSVELCGGTHVARTGDIGLLKIVGESAVASGVRRIEALTGEGARSYLATQDQRVREAAELLEVGPDEMIERLAAILDERRKLEQQLADAKRELALGGGAAADTASAIRDLGVGEAVRPHAAGRGTQGSARAGG